MNKKILVIDDDKDVLSLVSYILEEQGYIVVTTPSESILSQLSDIRPDLILLDHWLNSTYGGELCKQLKENSLYQHIPIILFSAINNLQEVAEDSCADAYIEKPFDIDDLEKVVSRLINN